MSGFDLNGTDFNWILTKTCSQENQIDLVDVIFSYLRNKKIIFSKSGVRHLVFGETPKEKIWQWFVKRVEEITLTD